MQKPTMPLDAAKYDIRVTWHGIKEDNLPPDASLVEGLPLDPPDDIGAWFLVQFERDTRIEEKQHVDRYCCIWAREKTAPKKQRAKPAANGEKPKKKGGRKKKQFNPQEVVFASDVPKAYKLMLCPHTAQMLHDAINVGEKREVSKEDTETYTARCHECSKRDEETAAEA